MVSRLLPGGRAVVVGSCISQCGLAGPQYHCGSGLVSCSVPEPLHLMLPLALLANSPVNQGSIGTPVVSISGCFSLFDKAIVLDGYNGWVSVGGWAGLQDPRHRGRGVIS